MFKGRSLVFAGPEQRLCAAADRAGNAPSHLKIQIFNLDSALFQFFPDGIPKRNVCDVDLRADGHPVDGQLYRILLGDRDPVPVAEDFRRARPADRMAMSCFFMMLPHGTVFSGDFSFLSSSVPVQHRITVHRILQADNGHICMLSASLYASSSGGLQRKNPSAVARALTLSNSAEPGSYTVI